MIQDTKDFIFYVKNNNGIIQIYEGNPRDPSEKKHTVVFELKAEGVWGFTLNKKGDYLLMTDQHDIYHL